MARGLVSLAHLCIRGVAQLLLVAMPRLCFSGASCRPFWRVLFRFGVCCFCIAVIMLEALSLVMQRGGASVYPVCALVSVPLCLCVWRFAFLLPSLLLSVLLWIFPDFKLLSRRCAAIRTVARVQEYSRDASLQCRNNLHIPLNGPADW